MRSVGTTRHVLSALALYKLESMYEERERRAANRVSQERRETLSFARNENDVMIWCYSVDLVVLRSFFAFSAQSSTAETSAKQRGRESEEERERDGTVERETDRERDGGGRVLVCVGWEKGRSDPMP